MGQLSEDSDKRKGVNVHSLDGLSCSVLLSVALLSCIVFSPVTCEVGVVPAPVMKLRS